MVKRGPIDNPWILVAIVGFLIATVVGVVSWWLPGIRADLDSVALEAESRSFDSTRKVEPGSPNSNDELGSVDQRAVCYMYDLKAHSRIANPRGAVIDTPESRAAATLLLSEWVESADALLAEQLLIENPEWDPADPSTASHLVDGGVHDIVAVEYLDERIRLASDDSGNPDVRLVIVESTIDEDRYVFVDLADPEPRSAPDLPDALLPGPFNVRFEPEGKTIRIAQDVCK